jgi:hypothetical protein
MFVTPFMMAFILWHSLKHGARAEARSWEGAKGLEWTVPSPAPHHTFTTPAGDQGRRPGPRRRDALNDIRASPEPAFRQHCRCPPRRARVAPCCGWAWIAVAVYAAFIAAGVYGLAGGHQ